jgi:V/A-type H+-transporting ATPase subunit I
MIVPMKKTTLVVLDRERVAALKELRRLGLLHLVAVPTDSPGMAPIAERRVRLEQAVRAVDDAAARLKAKGRAGKTAAVPAAGAGVPVAPMDASGATEAALALAAELAAAEAAAAKDRLESARLEAWGPLDPADFAALAGAGIDLAPAELPRRVYASLPDSVRVLYVSGDKKTVRLLAFREDGRLPEAWPAEAVLVPLPAVSTAVLAARAAGAEARAAALRAELAALAPAKPAMERELVRVAAEAEFEAARAGMALLTDESDSEGLACLEGFAPYDRTDAVKAAARRHGWALIIDDPADGESVPTQLRNSALVRVIQPVFDFLGTVPNYREYEISAWFLLFFCIFFAMIFGDAGYGSVLLAIAAALSIQAKRRGRPVPDAVRLLFLLSGFTIFWGVLTLSWFGLAPEALPSFLRAIDLDWLSNANPDSGNNVKVFCFSLGTIQLVVAHLKNARRDWGSPKLLAQVGQIMMLVGMLTLAFNLVIDANRFPLPPWTVPVIGAGFLLNFLFANYESGWGFWRGLLKGIVGSLANFISVFLGVVNVFADIVSYIRLWAVGLAGVAISQTINNMAGPLLGEFAFFLIAVTVLVFGHGINMILSVLSVIVHGVRLNMLEFSGHLGMEWSGFAYDPFREKAEINDNPTKEQP